MIVQSDSGGDRENCSSTTDIVNTDSRKFSFLDQGIGLSPSLNYDLGMPKSTMFNACVINELRNELMNIG